jgi:hypothetical protein
MSDSIQVAGVCGAGVHPKVQAAELEVAGLVADRLGCRQRVTASLPSNRQDLIAGACRIKAYEVARPCASF